MATPCHWGHQSESDGHRGDKERKKCQHRIWRNTNIWVADRKKKNRLEKRKIGYESQEEIFWNVRKEPNDRRIIGNNK